MIEAFRLRVADEALADLELRLRNTRWPDELEGAGWTFGSNLKFMRKMHAFWLEEYDWRAAEAKINSFGNFVYRTNAARIHFIHEQGHGPHPLPLIITHGWPGGFAEMLKLIPILTDPASHGGDPQDAFSVVVPSIPGYGFSDRPTRPGTNIFRIADLWAELMTALGYERFGAQGGDWGFWVSTALGLNHSPRLIGLHLNYVSTGFRPDLSPGTSPITSEEQSYLDRVAKWRDDDGAYFAVQATRPQTLSYGMTDSPVGLAAWLIEKFQRWSDCNGEPDNAFTMDELITNAMIYWLTNTVHSSFRLYSEARNQPLHLSRGQRVSVPTGIVRLPRELPMPPRSWAERAFDIRHWTELPRGGHFAAMECPFELAEDIRTFFRPLR